MRRSVLLLAAVAVVLVLASGVALARTINCDGGRCQGIRPSSFTLPYLYAAPQDAGFEVGYSTVAIGRFRPFKTGAMQHAGFGLPRTHLPRTRVNRSSSLSVLPEVG